MAGFAALDQAFHAARIDLATPLIAWLRRL